MLPFLGALLYLSTHCWSMKFSLTFIPSEKSVQNTCFFITSYIFVLSSALLIEDFHNEELVTVVGCF